MAIEKVPWKSGKGFKFRVTYRNPITKQLERRYFTAREHGTTEDAELAARQFDLDVKRRIRRDPLSFAGPDARRSATFKELAESYYAAKLRAREIAASTVKNDLYRCNTVLFPMIGSTEAAKITDMDMAAVVRAYRDRGCRQSSIRRAVTIIKAVFSWAKTDGRIKSNPVRDFECNPGREEKIPPPTWDEFWRIHDHAAPHMQRAMILATALGVRVGASELLQLKKSETWLDLGVIRVWSAKKKQRLATREVDLLPWVADFMRAWLAEDAKNGHTVDQWVNFQGKPVKTIKTAWSKALRRAGITRRINPYSLRHLHATEALDNGADISALAANMGTSPEVLRKHYQHLSRSRLRSAIEAAPDLSKRPLQGEQEGEQKAQ